MIQPITCPDSFGAGGAAIYGTGACPGSNFSYTFDSTEPDPRLQGKLFSFPNMATIVEASRGNLDNQANWKGALPSPYNLASHWGSVIDFTATGLSGSAGLASVVQIPNPGAAETYYQLAYQRLAMLESQPYATAVDGAVNGFFYKLNGLADCRFGLVGFSQSTADPPPSPAVGLWGGSTSISAAGPNLLSIGTYDVDSFWVAYFPKYGKVWTSLTGLPIATPGGAPADNIYTVNGGGATMEGFRVPRAPLDSGHNDINEVSGFPINYETPDPTWTATDGSPAGQIWSSYSAGANGLWNGRPLSDTYTAEALATAIKYFNNGVTSPGYLNTDRPAARKAIVFFTDGEPTGGIGGPDGGNSTGIQAPAAKTKGISIFTVGLNMNGNAQLTADQKTFLGDNTGGNGPGLAYIAGNGGAFFQCSNSLQVRQAFINVARRLSQNQQ